MSPTSHPAFQAWNDDRIKLEQKHPPLKQRFQTISGLDIDPLYLPEELDETYLQSIGFPGSFPFTRGVQPNMYRGKHWTMRMYAGFGDAQESNERYKYILANGGSGLSVAFDLPTQMGYDSDHPMAEGEVGKVGVAIDSIEDMATLFQGIPLDKVSTSMTINATASILLAFYIAVAEQSGVRADQISGTIQNDLFKEYVARGTYIYPPRESLRIITDIFEFCTAHVPKWNTISVSGYHIREAGCNAIQEIAFTLAHGLAYVKAAVDKGLNVNDFAPRISFFFNLHNDFLEEIAKLRAARRLWAKLMRDRFKANDRACMLRFHTQTAGSMLTAQQVPNNIVRVALQAMAAVLGGTQSLHTNGADEALGLPTEDSARTALRTQQIVAYETGVTNFVDPLAGSYAIETLTNQLEAAAMDYIKRIDDLGGVIRAIETGFEQREIQQSAYKYQQEIEKGERIVVGVNQFEIQESTVPQVLHVNPALEQNQIQRVKALKSTRDGIAVQNRLTELREGAAGTQNLMPLILAAAKSKVTLGEIADTLRGVFGVYHEKIVL